MQLDSHSQPNSEQLSIRHIYGWLETAPHVQIPVPTKEEAEQLRVLIAKFKSRKDKVAKQVGITTAVLQMDYDEVAHIATFRFAATKRQRESAKLFTVILPTG